MEEELLDAGAVVDEADRVVVDRLDRCAAKLRNPRHHRVFPGVQHVAVDDVRRRELAVAEVKLHPLAELEGPLGEVRAVLPREREPVARVVAGHRILGDQALERRVQHVPAQRRGPEPIGLGSGRNERGHHPVGLGRGRDRPGERADCRRGQGQGRPPHDSPDESERVPSCLHDSPPSILIGLVVDWIDVFGFTHPGSGLRVPASCSVGQPSAPGRLRAV